MPSGVTGSSANTRATSWASDPELLLLLPSWEAAWLPRPTEGIADRTQAFIIDMAALGHALHAVIRPAALLPESAPMLDPFALALRKIELESGRLMQAQSMLLKSSDLLPLRSAVSTAIESRHEQVCRLWDDLLSSIGVERRKDG
jgi:hypothetical protein